MEGADLERIEIELVVEAMRKGYGFDFRHYSQASLKRRIRNFMAGQGLHRPSELIPKVLSDRSYMASLVYAISVPVTEMFRDPRVYRVLRKAVIPVLKTYPHVKIWHAGCATGEEVYSMAIVLHEEGLGSRCQIYATDLNDKALSRAKEGIYPVDAVKSYQDNYVRSGGRSTLSEYFHSKYDSIIMSPELKKRLVFANHNLVSDASFGEFHVIMCRNVMIYFKQELQDRVLKLFANSLVPRGFLCLGTKENIAFSRHSDLFVPFAEREKVYQRAWNRE